MIFTPAATSAGRLRHRDAVRRREEHDVAVGEIGLRGIGEREVVAAAQAGEHVGDRGARLAARGDRAHVRLRMRAEQAQQLDAGVAGAADDADLQHEPTSINVRSFAACLW